MITVATHNEQERLKALYRYKVLDTAPEEEFDSITQLAAEICDVPVAMINLVDKDRQWAKSMIGLPESARQVERDHTVCQHTIQHEKPLEINDLTRDPRFASLPAVNKEDGLRYYLGAPLINPEGHVLGAICVLDFENRIMSDAQKRQMEILANVVITRLELKRKNDQLKELNNYKIKLMKMLSHDLRSPLNGIIGVAGILKSMTEEEDSEQAEMLDLVEQGGMQMNQMISEIMNYTLIESQDFSLNLKETDLSDALQSVEKLYKPTAQVKNISLTITNTLNGASVKLDEEKIEHILGNLLSNAIKYTPKGGRVKAEILLQEENGDNMLVIIITDNGIGMKQEQVENLFSTNQKIVTDGTDGEKSTGIGLTIIKSFVDLHKGTISVESTFGEGSRFTVKIPV